MEKSKAWYLEAVRGYLIYAYALMGWEADILIEASNLRDALDEFPFEQLHYAVESTASDIYEKHKEKVTPQYMS